MKQDKTEPYQACFLSTYVIVNTYKDGIKRETIKSGEINLLINKCINDIVNKEKDRITMDSFISGEINLIINR